MASLERILQPFAARHGRRVILVAVLLAVPLLGRAGDTDYVDRLSKDPKLNEALGLAKLSDAEKVAWNRIIAAAFAAGVEAAGPKPAAPAAEKGTTEEWHGKVWQTKADLDGEDVIKLRNGAVFEVTGFAGFGMSRDALLIQEGSRWRLWVAGKREFSGTLLRRPEAGTPIQFRRVLVDSVSSDGEILKTGDGHVYEVAILDRLHTSLWLATTEILLLSDGRVVNMNEPMPEFVSVRQLK